MSMMDEHLPDNPVWSALTTGCSHLSMGGDQAKCFQKSIAPFVGIKSSDPSCFQELQQLATPEKVLVLATSFYCEPLPEWKVIYRDKIVQMIYRSDGHAPEKTTHEIIELNISHVPAMLELTALTKPGPFLNETIRFGSYHGIFVSNQLVAMAGRRFHVNNFIEISAVCTHPDFVGRGLGTALLCDQINRILDENSISLSSCKGKQFGSHPALSTFRI